MELLMTWMMKNTTIMTNICIQKIQISKKQRASIQTS